MIRMIVKRVFVGWFIQSLWMMLFACFAFAQQVSPSHLEAARAAIAAIHVTDQFDYFLPSTAFELKNELMIKDPNLDQLISATVDEQALLLVARRADLEKEVVRIYAKNFTEDELKGITAFYSSVAGKKLLKQGPKVMSEAVEAYDIWRQGIAQDLALNVGKALDETVNKKSAQKNGSGENNGANKGESGSIPASRIQTDKQ